MIARVKLRVEAEIVQDVVKLAHDFCAALGAWVKEVENRADPGALQTLDLAKFVHIMTNATDALGIGGGTGIKEKLDRQQEEFQMSYMLMDEDMSDSIEVDES